MKRQHGCRQHLGFKDKDKEIPMYKAMNSYSKGGASLQPFISIDISHVRLNMESIAEIE
jgi:hypothetical protein